MIAGQVHMLRRLQFQQMGQNAGTIIRVDAIGPDRRIAPALQRAIADAIDQSGAARAVDTGESNNDAARLVCDLLGLKQNPAVEPFGFGWRVLISP